jgi:plasmid stabilization system protein ParE
VTARVIVSPSADADTDEIITYLAKRAGAATADKYGALFSEVYERLAVHPDMYAVRPVLGPRIRAAVVPPYLVIYEHAIPDVVNILRILHGRRRLTPALLYS